MDSDIEIVDHDDSEIPEIFTDFSQVKIEVHGGDVAEKLIEDLADQTENHQDYDEEFEENPVAYTENDIQEIPEDYPEQIPVDFVDAIPEDHAETHHPQECMDYSEVPIKQEVERSDGTDFTDNDELSAVPFNEDLPPEDIYHFNNKIILGSKPCQNNYFNIVSVVPYNNDLRPEDIYHYKNKIILGSKPCSTAVSLQQKSICYREEPIEAIDVYENNNIRKENLDAVVLLEDFSHRLKKNSCFCVECGILFATSIDFDAHNMSEHSLLVAVSRNVAIKSTTKPAYARKSTGALVVRNNKNIARKSTGGNSALVSKFCNHCNMIFPDHTTLIKHLYELIPLKQFKCPTCDTVFNTQKDLIEHNVVHIKPEKRIIKKEKVIKEATDFRKKLLYEEDLKKKRLVPPKTEIKPIPMSVLFQCTKCNIHFLTALAGSQHWISCNAGTNNRMRTCKTCKRKLRTIDCATHKKQHEICTKFKVYKITNNIYERTLCKCPKCGVHFKEMTMKPHFKRCGKIPTAHCQKCNILIPRSKIEWHSNKHNKQNLKPKDFIMVQYFLQNKTVKRKLAPIATPAKKIKLEFSSTNIKKETPVTRKTLQNNIVKKTNKGPINKSMNVSTEEEREVGRKIKMVNRLKFEKGNKVRLYFCKNCCGCCKNNSNRLIHLNKQCQRGQKLNDRVICPECGLQFNRKTIVSHENLHKKRSLTVHDIVFYHIGTLRRMVPSIPTYPRCKNCKITFFCTTIKNSHICGEDYETCNVCGEKFHNSAYSKHIEFHKLIRSAGSSKTEAQMLPELMQRYVSFNTMWNVVFSCSKCDIITDLYDKAIEHSQGHLNLEVSTKNIKCYICNLKFDETCWSKHSELHSQMKINSKDFKILSYNPKQLLSEEWFQLFESIPEQQIRQITDKSLYGYERGVKIKLLKDGLAEFTLYCCSNCKVCCPNNDIAKHIKNPCKKPANICKTCDIPFSDITALRSHEIIHEKGVMKEEFRVVLFTKVKSSTLKFKNSTATFELYKCRKCNTCLRYSHNITRHKCLGKSRKAKCTKCNQTFNRCSLPRHKEEHRMHPEFNFKNLTVNLFDPPDENYDNYDDDDDDDAFKPVKRKYKKRNNKPSKPEKVGKVTPRTAKVDTSTAETDTSKTAKKAKVYKCGCGLHYTSIKAIEKHIQKRCPDYEISIENCSKCGLLFPTDILVTHLCKHHSKNTKIFTEIYQRTKEPDQSFENVESTSENAVSENTVQEPRRKIASVTKESIKSKIQSSNVKLYKCSECNIYFIVQNTCYKHVHKIHKPIDPKQYIECKLCGLQFTLKTLPNHISRHHQGEFSLDDVLVEEYHPTFGKGPPKITLYMASERVQSLQVTSSIEEGRIVNS